MEYLINVLLTNGDILVLGYATRALAIEDFAGKIACSSLVVFASLHDAKDNELAVIDHTTTLS